jgi:hypothetical protein
MIDGDNIQLEVFINEIKPQIEYKYGKEFQINLYCQTNLVLKYESMRTLNLSINCSRTKNKNSTDAQILYQTGVLIGENPDNIVLIISNDQIFNEISSHKVILIGNKIHSTKLKLSKNNLLSVFKELSKDCKLNPSKDIFLDDFLSYFSKYSLSEIESLINKIPNLCISKSNCVYIK